MIEEDWQSSIREPSLIYLEAEISADQSVAVIGLSKSKHNHCLRAKGEFPRRRRLDFAWSHKLCSPGSNLLSYSLSTQSSLVLSCLARPQANQASLVARERKLKLRLDRKRKISQPKLPQSHLTVSMKLELEWQVARQSKFATTATTMRGNSGGKQVTLGC